MPFLENVTRGRGIPRERLEAVAEHYHHFGGVSPINEQNKALIAAVEKELAAGRHRPARLLGQPQLGALRRGHLAAAGRRRHRARLRLRDVGLRLVLRVPAVPRGHRPGPRRRAAAARPRRSCRTTSTPRASCRPTPTRWPRRSPRCPRTSATPPAWSRRRTASRTSMAAVAGPDGRAYEAELQAAAERVVAEAAPGRPFDLVWQSRSGPPSVPWLEPDVNDHLRALAAGGRDRRRPLPGRVHQRPPRGDLGPGQRGEGDGRGARAGLRPRRDGGHPPGVRRVGPGPAGGAPRRGPPAPGHELPRELLLRDPGRPPAAAAARASPG